MSLDTDTPIVEFEHIWVHSKRIPPINTSDQRRTVKTQIHSVSAIYDKWMTKFKKISTPDQRLPTHKKVLINDISGTLLAGQITVLTGASGSGKSFPRPSTRHPPIYIYIYMYLYLYIYLYMYINIYTYIA